MNGSNYCENHGAGRQNREPGQDQDDIILLGGLALALLVFLASFVPQPMVLATLSAFLHTGALAFAIAALCRNDRLPAGRCTCWDVAALFYGLSLLLGLFVEPDAVRAVVATMGQ